MNDESNKTPVETDLPEFLKRKQEAEKKAADSKKQDTNNEK